MAHKPYLSFYVNDYMTDTAHLSGEEHGLYLMLIFALWQTEKPLKNDDVELARISRFTLKRFRQLKSRVLPFFIEKDGQLTHKRVTEELAKFKEKSDKSRAAGLLSGKKRREKSLANAERSFNDCSNDDHQTLEHPLNHTDTDTEINKLSSLAAANNLGGKRVPSHAAAEKKSNPKNSHNAKPAVPSAGRPDVCEIESSGKQPAVPSPGRRASVELETADVPSLAKKSPREIYLDVLSSRFDHTKFPNAKVFAMLTAWEEHNVEKRDVESALEFIFGRGDHPTSPVYFHKIVLDFAEIREKSGNYESLTGAKKYDANLTHSELNAIAIAELKRENEEREKRLAAIDAEREQQRQGALDAAANAEKLRTG